MFVSINKSYASTSFLSLRVELAESQWKNGKSQRKSILNLGTLRVRGNIIGRKNVALFLVSATNKLDFNDYDPRFAFDAIEKILKWKFEIEDLDWALNRAVQIKRLKQILPSFSFHGRYFYPVGSLRDIIRNKNKRNADWQSKNPEWLKIKKIGLSTNKKETLPSETLFRIFKRYPRVFYKSFKLFDEKTQIDCLEKWQNSPTIKEDFPDLKENIK